MKTLYVKRKNYKTLHITKPTKTKLKLKRFDMFIPIAYCGRSLEGGRVVDITTDAKVCKQCEANKREINKW